MKNFLLLFILSMPAFAGYVAESKFNQCVVNDYFDRGDCQRIEKETCYDRGATGECGIFKLVSTKSGKEIQIDEIKHTQVKNKRKQDDVKEQKIQKALAAMDCGRRVMATVFVQNAPKDLSSAQITQQTQTYAVIKGLLETGSLETARGMIEAVQPDGEVVTESDKVALIAELDSCKSVESPND